MNSLHNSFNLFLHACKYAGSLHFIHWGILIDIITCPMRFLVMARGFITVDLSLYSVDQFWWFFIFLCCNKQYWTPNITLTFHSIQANISKQTQYIILLQEKKFTKLLDQYTPSMLHCVTPLLITQCKKSHLNVWHSTSILFFQI